MNSPALTLLYVPGDRPDRFPKAMASGADVVIVDLEDAVPPDRKEQARQSVREFVRSLRGDRVQVRLNDLRSGWCPDDVAALAGSEGVAGFRIPKVESATDLDLLAQYLPPGVGMPPLHLLVESARGVEAAFDIASAHPAVSSIGLGEADLSSELGLSDEAGLAWTRGRIVVAARAAGLPRPAMSVYPRLGDDPGLAASCRAGRAMGFLGRAAIHPDQLAVIEQAFVPTGPEVTAAADLLAGLGSAEGSGVAVLPDGRFADRAMVEAAQATLALAERRGGGPEG